MGLDMYANRCGKAAVSNPTALVDLEIVDAANVERVAYWRKFNALHGWMEDLYRSRNGVGASFNCDSVVLTLADLDALEKALDERTLKPRAGFFFGEQEVSEFDVADTREFIAKARKAIAAGDLVYYTSWW